MIPQFNTNHNIFLERYYNSVTLNLTIEYLVVTQKPQFHNKEKIIFVKSNSITCQFPQIFLL